MQSSTKKKSVHSATRISGYCKTIFLIFVLQPPGHVYINSNLQIYVTASRTLISIWEDNSQVAVFHTVQVLSICKTCKDSMLIQWPLSAAHSYPRQETWKKKNQGWYCSLSTKEQQLSVSARTSNQALLLLQGEDRQCSRKSWTVWGVLYKQF